MRVCRLAMSGKRITSGGPFGTNEGATGIFVQYDDGTSETIEFDAPIGEAEASIRFFALVAAQEEKTSNEP